VTNEQDVVSAGTEAGAFLLCSKEGGAGLLPEHRAELGPSTATLRVCNPAYYCSSGSDGQLTAALFSNRIELWSNSEGKLAGTYWFAAREGEAVAISRHPAMVIGGFVKGDILAWPLKVGR
jgi:hypothetical protein